LVVAALARKASRSFRVSRAARRTRRARHRLRRPAPHQVGDIILDLT